MDKLRDFLQSFWGRILMLVCLSPVVLVGFDQLFSGGQLSANELAKVGETSIATATVQNEATANRSQLLAQGIDGALINDKALNAQAYETVLNRTLLEVQSKKLGMQISDEMISRLLQQDPQFTDSNGKFSNDLFAQFLTANGLTKDMLFANYRNQLNIRQLSLALLNGAILPKTQISRLIDLQAESRPIWVKRLKWQDYADKVTVSDAEIAEYYEKNKGDLTAPALIDLHYLSLDESALPKAVVSDEDIKATYQEYLKNNNLDKQELAQILLTGDKAQERAEQIASELKAGKDFAELAKQSDDPSGASGGNMGTFNPAVFGADAAKVEQALAGLQAGQVTAPVQTAFGWQIFKVVKAPEAPSLDELKDELTKIATDNKNKAAMADLVAQINTMATDGYALADIANELKLKVETIKDYPQENNQTALNQPIVISTAFDEHLTGSQSVSTSFEVNGKTMWVQPSNYRQSAPMTAEQAAPIVKQILTKQKASELALADAQAISDKFAGDTAGFDSLGKINRQNPTVNEQERATLFAKPAEAGKLVAWATLTDDGATAMVGGEIGTTATAQMSQEERDRAATMMTELVGQDHLEDYLEYLKTALEVKTNEEALKGL